MSRLWVVFSLAASLSLTACGGGGPEAKAPGRPLPSYAGHAIELFDDGIEPRAVGLELEGQPMPARSDTLLRERTQVGDAVMRVRIDTVSSHGDGVNDRYDLGLRVLDKIAGAQDIPGEFTVRVDKNSPSIGIVKSFQERLGGKIFIAFLREFVRPDGDSESHFHLSRDGKDVEAAVREAAALAEFAPAKVPAK
jgi:hypothetical protein